MEIMRFTNRVDKRSVVEFLTKLDIRDIKDSSTTVNSVLNDGYYLDKMTLAKYPCKELYVNKAGAVYAEGENGNLHMIIRTITCKNIKSTMTALGKLNNEINYSGSRKIMCKIMIEGAVK